MITTVAGNGTQALSGDGGPALQAQFLFPTTMVFDRAGNAYISDTQNRRARVISPSGTITEVAGGGTSPPAEGGLATEHRLDAVDIAADGDGNLYVADRWLGVYKVGADGRLAAVAGMGSIVPTDGVPAALASLEVTSLEVDRNGAVYLADNTTQRIWKVAGGLLGSVAGTTRGFGGDGGPATDARLDFWGPPMALDGAGQLFVFDVENRRIRRIDTQGIITTVAGSGAIAAEGAVPPSPVPGTPATFVPLPGGDIAIRGGDLFLVDPVHDRVWKVAGVARSAPPATSPSLARALRANAWGHNGYGQLGAADLTEVVALAGGGSTAWPYGPTGPSGRGGWATPVSSAPASTCRRRRPGRSRGSRRSPPWPPARTTRSPSRPTATYGPGGTMAPGSWARGPRPTRPSLSRCATSMASWPTPPVPSTASPSAATARSGPGG